MSKTIYTAIFGAYDTLKEPLYVTPGWRYICFTDQPFESGVWEIKRSAPIAPNNQLSARYYKIMFHRHIEDEDSIWIDGSFQINCDLNLWWNVNFKEFITCIKHPWRDCIYEEAKICIAQGKGISDKIGEQIYNYKRVGFPEKAGLIQSGILLRRKNKELENLCTKWYNQVKMYSIRDQISFSYIFKDYPTTLIHNFNYSNNKNFLFTKHQKR